MRPQRKIRRQSISARSVTSGSGSRTFYVGKDLTQEDIKAKFEDGVLKLTVPKIEKKPEEPKSKYITIE